MSLGVLNNLNAIYAANNLNNTSNSLSTVLQQLSSGSKINSGADDAAGLSLVNGLQANSMALAQSQTNASQGVGLLKVADGALSQVTNLLNRAVTLATEASNGTLNSSQDTAANNEYQSILSEINNIGSTTTYNGQTVFGSKTDIYTGDSSSAGASINSLNIRSLSSDNVGDSNGAMAYSSGTNNVFVDLSNAGTNASVTDSLGASSATTTLAVNYMTKGSGGAAVAATANISVGAGTSYANTAQGLLSAINGAGLGLTASFGTATQAGSAAVAAAKAQNVIGGGSANDTGIIISGAGVGTGTNGAGEVGTLTVAANADQLGGTLNIKGSDGANHAITLGAANSTDTLSNLASTINQANYGVTATYSTTNKNIVFTSSNSAVTVSGTGITDQTTPAAAGTVGFTTTGIAGTAAGSIGTVTVDNKTDMLTGGTVTIKGDDGGAAKSYTLGTAGTTDTLANLANQINNDNKTTASFGITASVSADGLTLNLTAAGVVASGATTSVVLGSGANAPTATKPAVNTATSLTGTPTIGDAAYAGTVGTLTIGAAGTAGDLLGGSITVGANSITLGTQNGANKTDTLANLAQTINNGNYGVQASLDSTGKIMTFTSANTAIKFDSTTATDAGHITGSINNAGSLTLAGGASTASTLGGTLNIGNNAITISAGNSNSTASTLAAYINKGNYGVTASLDSTGLIMSFASTSGAPVAISGASLTASGGTSTATSTNFTQSVDKSAYYSIGVTGSVQDTSTAVNTGTFAAPTWTYGGTALTGIAADNNGSGGIATISYSDGAGQSLKATTLSTQADAKVALNALNAAITAVAAQDGYVGAQINQLNAVSSVLSTQQQNVTAAQNAVQATDYATAASNMSKYQILSQTGISALAQANSMQQEVTKLLQ